MPAFLENGMASRVFVLLPAVVTGRSHLEKRMRIRQIAVSALFAAGLAALPLATAEAQYYYPPCSPFPLAWPFCIAGAAVNTAAAIVTAPFAALSGPYYYPYYGYGYGYRYGYYGRPRRHYARRHYSHYYYGAR
jgi:hypothetical protein